MVLLLHHLKLKNTYLAFFLSTNMIYNALLPIIDYRICVVVRPDLDLSDCFEKEKACLNNHTMIYSFLGVI